MNSININISLLVLLFVLKKEYKYIKFLWINGLFQNIPFLGKWFMLHIGDIAFSLTWILFFLKKDST